MELEKLVSILNDANNAYRLGSAIMSDEQYDDLLDELQKLYPEHHSLSKIGISPDRKTKLPIHMASMNKVKTIEDIENWLKNKNIPSIELIIMPKYDGISLLVDEYANKVYTRGDGEYGSNCDNHYKYVRNKYTGNDFKYTYGEAVISKKDFNKYAEEKANPRNMVSGLFGSDDCDASLTDVAYIKYGGIGKEFSKKSDLIDELNKFQEIKVAYTVINSSNISKEYLYKLFIQYSSEYIIDGLILEVNDIKTQKNIGKERNDNPGYARAYKSDEFEEKKETVVTGITWNISKQGYLKPIIQIKPVNLDGATVTNITGNNASWIRDMEIGVGSVVRVKRSGMVIPLITHVLTKKEFIMPDLGMELVWHGKELKTKDITDEQNIKKIVSFFEILDAKNISDGVVIQLWKAGYRTIKDIISLKEMDLKNLDGFGKKKAEIIVKSIKESITNVELPKLMHASGFFEGLGSKKLALFNFSNKPDMNEILKISGIGEIQANIYINGYDVFHSFLNECIDIKIIQKTKKEGVLSGKIFVFSGVRDKELEKILEERGGTIGNSINTNTTYLIMKEVGSNSSKEVKANELGVNVITLSNFKKWLY